MTFLVILRRLVPSIVSREICPVSRERLESATILDMEGRMLEDGEGMTQSPGLQEVGVTGEFCKGVRETEKA
jgi:hypothetical protein